MRAWKVPLFRKVRRYLIVVVLCIPVVIYQAVMCGFWLQLYAESRWSLHTLCQDYRAGRVTGNLCLSLCQTRTLTIKQALTSRSKQVYEMRWQTNELLVFKSTHSTFASFDFTNSSCSKASLAQLALESVQSIVPFSLSKVKQTELSARMWSGETGTDSKTWSDATCHSYTSLLQQPEYVLLKFFGDFNDAHYSEIFPQINGSCGHFYGVEALNNEGALQIHEILRPARYVTSWKRRAEIALALMDLISVLDSDHQEPLTVCDMTSLQFGMVSPNKAKVLDGDALIFEGKLREYFRKKKCKDTTLCYYFRCESQCNNSSGHCSEVRMNNNLQLLCQRVLVGIPGRTRGLLNNPPTQELAHVLDQCASPAPPPGVHLPAECSVEKGVLRCSSPFIERPHFQASPEIYQQLQLLLRHSIHTGQFAK